MAKVTVWSGRPKDNRPSYKELKAALREVPAVEDGSVTWGMVMDDWGQWKDGLKVLSDGTGGRQHTRWFAHASWKAKLRAAAIATGVRPVISEPSVVAVGTKAVLVLTVQAGKEQPMPMVEDVELGDRGGAHGSYGKAVGAALELLGYGIMPYYGEYWKTGQMPEGSTASGDSQEPSEPRPKPAPKPTAKPAPAVAPPPNVRQPAPEEWGEGTESDDAGFVEPRDWQPEETAEEDAGEPSAPEGDESEHDPMAAIRKSAREAISNTVARIVAEVTSEAQKKILRKRWQWFVTDILAHYVEVYLKIKPNRDDPLIGLDHQALGAATAMFEGAYAEKDSPIRKKILGLIQDHQLRAGGN